MVVADGIPFDGDKVKDRTTTLLRLTENQQVGTPSKQRDLIPKGFVIEDKPEDKPKTTSVADKGILPVIAVAADLPVHRFLHRDPNLLKGGSPFLLLMQQFGNRIELWHPKVQKLHQIQKDFLDKLHSMIPQATETAPTQAPQKAGQTVRF